MNVCGDQTRAPARHVMLCHAQKNGCATWAEAEQEQSNEAVRRLGHWPSSLRGRRRRTANGEAYAKPGSVGQDRARKCSSAILDWLWPGLNPSLAVGVGVGCEWAFISQKRLS